MTMEDGKFIKSNTLSLVKYPTSSRPSTLGITGREPVAINVLRLVKISPFKTSSVADLKVIWPNLTVTPSV